MNLNFEIWDRYEGKSVKPVSTSRGVKLSTGDYELEIKCALARSELENKKLIQEIIEFVKDKGYFQPMYSLKETAEFLNSQTLQQFEHKINQIKESLAKIDRVVVYGYSDDLLEFEGAIYDEVYAYGGVEVPISSEGIVKNECSEPNCPYFSNLVKDYPKIKGAYKNGTWEITASFPYEQFEVYEHSDDTPYIKGIVFDMKDIEKSKIKIKGE